MPTLEHTDIVSGRVDEAINEAVGDIWPGAHVAVTQYNGRTQTWTFDITVPQIPTVELTDAAMMGERALSELIGAAEDAVRLAKIKLLTAWGIDTSDITPPAVAE